MPSGRLCRRRGIPITNTPDVLTEDVADMGLALTLCVMRRIVEGDRWVRAGRWVKEGDMPLGSTPARQAPGHRRPGPHRQGAGPPRRGVGMRVAYHGRQPQPDVAYPYHADPVSSPARATCWRSARRAVPPPAV